MIVIELRRAAGRAIRALTALCLVVLVQSAAHAETKVQLGLIGKWAPYAAVYLAEDLGYYKEAGLSVEITTYRGGGAAQQALAAGEADIINFTPPGVALAVNKGVKEKIVGPGMPTALGWHCVVLKDSPIASPKDLAGKKVGITRKGSTTDFLALKVADRAGVSIDTIPVGWGSLIPSLKAKEVDAICIDSTLASKLLLSGEGRSVVDLGKDLEPTLPDVWVASQSLIDDKPEVVEAWLKAMYKATAHLKANREFGLKYLKEYTEIEDDRVVEREYDIVIQGRSTAAKIPREWLESSLTLATLAGLEDLPSIDEIYTDRFESVIAE